MAKMSTTITRGVIGVVVVAIVVVAGYFVFFNSSAKKTVTAQFASAVGIYKGTPVRILGVDVGEVTSVKPGPQYVAVKMTYDAKYRIRESGASAVEVANSLVSDRYIDLSTLISKTDPAKALPNNAIIATSHTSGPAELDDIYAQLDKLTVALGPDGANAGGKDNGALSALLKVSAANLKGNGAALGNSITKLAEAARTLSDNKGNLFGTVKNLQKFTSTLKSSDAQVRLFNQQLAEVAGDLANERGDLGSALKLLGLALDDVNTFVKANASKFHTDIAGLENITSILVRQKASLNETLAVAPVALANIVHAYNPSTGTLGTRSNLLSLTDLSGTGAVKVLCSTLTSLLGIVPGVGDLTKAACPSSTSGSSSSATKASSATSPAALSVDSTTIDTMMNGGLPVGMLIGSGS